MLNEHDLLEQCARIHEDLVEILDGIDDDTLEKACRVVSDRFAMLRIKAQKPCFYVLASYMTGPDEESTTIHGPFDTEIDAKSRENRLNKQDLLWSEVIKWWPLT